ncbi:MAG: hypothetical protein WC684_06850 [Hyphomicrobium sp.]|jgi:hypothetical protein
MDYIPPTGPLFSAWLLNFATLIAAAPTTYGLVSGDATVISAQNAAFQAAYTLATDPSTRTSVTVAAKDAAMSLAKATVRPYAVSISQNSGVTDGDKTAVGVTVRKLVPTPIPAPTDAPQVSFVSAIPLETVLKIVNSATPTSKAKPFGAVIIEVWRSIGTVPATDPAQLSYVGGFTKIPVTLAFEAGDQGKICTVASRYATAGGNGGVAKTGPWSALLSFNVL